MKGPGWTQTDIADLSDDVEEVRATMQDLWDVGHVVGWLMASVLLTGWSLAHWIITHVKWFRADDQSAGEQR